MNIQPNNIFECQCGKTANRPVAFNGLPNGWLGVQDDGRQTLICDDCARSKLKAGNVRKPQGGKPMAHTILLRSGAYIDLAAPDCSKVTINDIAVGLSRMCRFAGQCEKFYSVAEHSVIASRIAPRKFAYEALMHDATEALIGDVTSPLKAMLPDYRKIEQAVEYSLFAAFNVQMGPTAHQTVKCADLAMLEAEKRKLFTNMPRQELLSNAIGTAYRQIGCWLPDEAERRFLERFYELSPDVCKNRQVAA